MTEAVAVDAEVQAMLRPAHHMSVASRESTQQPHPPRYRSVLSRPGTHILPPHPAS